MLQLASDGIPKFYYEITEDKYAMAEMKKVVEAYCEDMLDNGDTDFPVNEVCSACDISSILADEVEDMIVTWKEAKSL